MYFAVGRIGTWNELSYNKNRLIILPGTHRYAELYSRNLHEIGHLGVNADIAKICSEYWIIGIHQLVKCIKYNCHLS